jgi:hypothetical protein
LTIFVGKPSTSDGRALIALIVLYSAATWWYTIPFGVVWDDWVLLAHSASSLLSVASEAGRADQALLILPFQASRSPWTWALAAWLCLGVAVVFIFLTARRIRGVSLREAFWISALTAAVPFYQARFTLSVLPYAVSAFCFTASLLLLVRHLDSGKLGSRIGSLIFLVLACSTSSFLTLCWIPPALIAWNNFAKSDAGEARVIGSLRAALSYADFLLLPAIAFLVRRWLFPAHGLYATYYQLKGSPLDTLAETLSVLRAQIADWGQILSVFLPNWNLRELADAMVPAGFILLLGYVALRRFKFESALEDVRWPFYFRPILLMIALLTPVLALYPYIAVQQPPRFLGLWETRHQLTLMLVSGCVLVCLIRSVVGARGLDAIATVLLFLFLTLDYGAGRQFLVDRLEQRELEQRFAADPLPSQSLVFVVEADRSHRMFGRFLNFYELTHIVNRADGHNDRLAMSNREILDPRTGTYAVDANPGVVEKMLQVCHLRGRPEFGFANFSYNGRVVRESIDSQIDYVSLMKAIGFTVSGRPTNWIKLKRQSLNVASPACSAHQSP